MNILFLMDPIETVNNFTDTTYTFIKEAYNRGHKTYFLAKDNIHLQSKLLFELQELYFQDENLALKETIFLKEDKVDIIFIRPNPPFDEDYLHLTWLLDLADKRIVICNNPASIRTVNEKIWANNFQQYVPETLITNNKNLFLEFTKKHKTIIAKPCNSFGGQGIFFIKDDDKNKHVIFETLANENSIILQEYIKEAKEGDKRVLLLNGSILGAVLRKNTKDHRNNFYAGGEAFACTISEKQHQIIEQIKPFLQKMQLFFVGLDFLGDYLIEINVTSPTCLQEMNRLYNDKLEVKVIDFVEQQRKSNLCQN